MYVVCMHRQAQGVNMEMHTYTSISFFGLCVGVCAYVCTFERMNLLVFFVFTCHISECVYVFLYKYRYKDKYTVSMYSDTTLRTSPPDFTNRTSSPSSFPTGPVYRAWATDGDLGLTCPLGPGEASRCPCAAVNYQLFAAPGDHHFYLHQSTGVLSRNLSVPLYPGTTHNYKLMVQST